MINYKKLTVAFICGTILAFPLGGCGLTSGNTQTQSSNISESTTSQNTDVDTSGLVLEFDDEDLVTTWDSSQACNITLTQNNISINGSGASAEDSVVTITSAGTYVISGDLTDGNICVNTQDKSTVRIILNGVNITSQSTAPFLVEDAKKVIVTLADNTVNTFTDSTRTTTESEDYSAAVYSKEDFVLNGNGTLKINAGYRNGMKSSDDLKIVSGNYQITAAEDGIIGKDLLGIAGGTFTVNAGTDGLKSSYDTDTTKGNIIIKGGSYQITSGNDGIQAENILAVHDGDFQITTGVGSSLAVMTSGNDSMMGRMGGMGAVESTTTATETDTESIKGLKASNAIYVYGGTFNIDSENDGIHTNNLICIEGGNITIKSGDDGIHADSELQINGGSIDIGYCYEGLEAAQITINNGDISIHAEDDGMNASDGSSTEMAGGGFQRGGATQNNATQNSATQSSLALVINGGNIYVEADGDGLDSNGTLTINGGTTIVSGPVSSGNTAVDFESQCILNGGTLMAFGSNGMVETPTSASNGSCIVMTFTSQEAGTAFTLTDNLGNTVMTHAPEKAYSAAILYSSDIEFSQTYTATAGSLSQSVTVNSNITTSGSVSGMGGGMQKGNMQSGGMQEDNMKGGENANIPSDTGRGNFGDMSDNQGNTSAMPNGAPDGGNMMPNGK